jgi:hypothetical protein
MSVPATNEPTLRERMPDYLAVFGIGVAVGLVVGGAIGLFSSADAGPAIGYTLMLVGTGFLLAGGLRGSGFYAGGFGTVFSGSDEEHRATLGDPAVDESVALERARSRGADGGAAGGRRKVDPADRIRRRLALGPNPRAFWSVVAGFSYIALGIGVVSLFD